MRSILLDPGHGGSDSGAVGPTGLKESQVNLRVSQRLGPLLEESGARVSYTRTSDVFPSLSARTNQANREGVDLLISIHCNWWSDPNTTGIETLVFSTVSPAHPIAMRVQDALIAATGEPNRLVKVRTNLAILRDTRAAALLPEIGFISNRATETKMRSENYLGVIARAIRDGVMDAGPSIPQGPSGGINMEIVSETDISFRQAEGWAASKNATSVFVGLAELFWNLAGDHGRVNPAIAYAQSALETGYGRFGGVIDDSYHNTCGLKTTRGGGDKDPVAHHRFSDWEQGVKAHLDHLALYAGAPSYPRSNSPDPRHFGWLTGEGPTIATMGKSWAPSDGEYANKIVRMMGEMKAVPAVPGPGGEQPEPPPIEVPSVRCPNCGTRLKLEAV